MLTKCSPSNFRIMVHLLFRKLNNFKSVIYFILWSTLFFAWPVSRWGSKHAALFSCCRSNTGHFLYIYQHTLISVVYFRGISYIFIVRRSWFCSSLLWMVKFPLRISLDFLANQAAKSYSSFEKKSSRSLPFFCCDILRNTIKGLIQIFHFVLVLLHCLLITVVNVSTAMDSFPDSFFLLCDKILLKKIGRFRFK